MTMPLPVDLILAPSLAPVAQPLRDQATTAQLGLEPGDAFESRLARKQIKLVPLGAAEEE